MMRYLLAVLLFVSVPALAVPFLIGDVPTLNADKCQFTPAAPSVGPMVENNVVVDNANGLASLGYRVCKLDLAGTPAGPFAYEVNLKSTAWSITGPKALFASTAPGSLPGVGALRVAP